MTFKSCPNCGSIKETATITLNKLHDKINNKINALKFKTVDNTEHDGITDLELWEWTEAIKRALGEL